MPHNKGKTVGKMDRVAKNLSRLETELRHVQRNDNCGRLGPTGHAKKLIDKPKGQAGRSELKGGYNLQQAMGLAGDNRKYNAFRMIARRYTNRYLDTEKTLKEQDKLTVTLLLSYAQRKHQFLAKFCDNWPFNDFVASYLRNHVQYTKKHASEDDSETDDSDLSDGELDDMLNDGDNTSTSTSRQKRHQRIHDSDDSGTDEEHNSRPQKKLKFAHVSIPARAKPAPAPRIKPAPKSRMTQAPSQPSRPAAAHSNPSRPTTCHQVEANILIRHMHHEGCNRSTRAKTKPKPLATEASAAHLKIDTAINDDDDTYEFADLPLVCPNDNCRDLVPADPNIELRVYWLELEICAALRQLREEKLNIQCAKARGWPTIITWETVSDRVCKVTPPNENFPSWPSLADSAYQAMVTNHARPGYYGEKGKAIIQSAIFSMFDHEQISNEAFAPLDFKVYIEYYLIPWVAIHLISKDLECSLEEAYEEMIASADSGVSLHPMTEEDSRIERITRQHCVMAAEKRVEKVERFRKEMNDEIEKGKEEQRMHDDLAAKIAAKRARKVPVASKSQPTAGPSKFPGSYDDAAYEDDDESELSELPESIQVTPVPQPKPSRARPARRRSRR
ncbi:hypothetical protein DFJ58DRAFT_848338 [Suillus subalutaceus]|uniref:uncharacterized protein n=1 Tax=Suillus subalutaceus TaxID=48586 RepID=UPI001B86DEC3|nr:uncharacterized protein DFJ58DRAFT_848338 [Suillus subalutaceus]KAG1830961.1 hypothetical protein DFJ58DRAFT_848338 [Suillus subalutaceus]